jgi:S-formylglutathione hydrolase FrmB
MAGGGGRYAGAAAFVVALATLLLFAGPASANSCSENPPGYPRYTGHSPRVHRIHVGGVEHDVVLPTEYVQTKRRYPVLYLLHGADSTAEEWIECTDLLAYTSNSKFIIVLPGPDGTHEYMDWYDGSKKIETLHIKQLIPYVDRHYRTLSDRSDRAVAGLSMGGFGTMHYAARHPDLFVAAGSFSGVVDSATADPGKANAVDASAPGAFPPADEHPAERRNNNPPDIAPGLRGMEVFVTTGNETPCGPDEALAETRGEVSPGFEALALYMNRVFEDSLQRWRIPHAYVEKPCGMHSYISWQKDIRAFFPRLEASWGRPAATTFDYRRADSRFSVWGWSLRADPKRAPEFLEVFGAGRKGLTLHGSGLERVQTRRYFLPHQRVRITGATPTTAIADSGGRITLTVNLGPAHTHEQYTTDESSRPGYLRRRTIRFASVKPQATLTVEPRHTVAGKTTHFVFRALVKLGSARIPVSRALIRFAGRRARTGRRGYASIIARFAHGGAVVAHVGKPGVRGADATVIVKSRTGGD